MKSIRGLKIRAPRYQKLRDQKERILRYIAARGGVVKANQATLVRELQMPRRSLQKAITELRRDGLLVSLKNGIGRTTEMTYFLPGAAGEPRAQA